MCRVTSSYTFVMVSNKTDTDLLEAALLGYRLQIAQIEAKIAELTGKLKGDSAPVQAPAAEGGKRVLSAAARRRMAAAQKRRWAAVRKAAAPEAVKAVKAPTPKPAEKKRRMSAEGRRRIIEATKKRWAEYRAKQAAAAKKA